MTNWEKAAEQKPATVKAIRELAPEQCQEAAELCGWTIIDPDAERTRETLLVYAGRPRIQKAVRQVITRKKPPAQNR